MLGKLPDKHDAGPSRNDQSDSDADHQLDQPDAPLRGIRPAHWGQHCLLLSAYLLFLAE